MMVEFEPHQKKHTKLKLKLLMHIILTDMKANRNVNEMKMRKGSTVTPFIKPQSHRPCDQATT